MFSNPAFWVDIALLLLVVLFFALGAHRKIAKALDERSERIRAELDEARQLREEANALLAKYQRQKHEAEEQAKAIVATARKDAEAQMERARHEIEARAQARLRAVEQKIQTAQSDVVRELKAEAIDQAFAATRAILRNEMPASQAEALNNKAVGTLANKLH